VTRVVTPRPDGLDGAGLHLGYHDRAVVHDADIRAVRVDLRADVAAARPGDDGPAAVRAAAPHAARALVGARHARMLPVAALLGALLVSVADTLGRTVIAPGQLPAGLLAALVGTPYFVWLLWRSRLVD
jgi:ABC-type enterobactin transport system permease subunit